MRALTGANLPTVRHEPCDKNMPMEADESSDNFSSQGNSVELSFRQRHIFVRRVIFFKRGKNLTYLVDSIRNGPRAY